MDEKSYPSKFKDKTFLSLDGKISSLDGKISSLDGKKSSMDGIFICQKKISSFIFIHGSKVRMMMKDDGHGHSHSEKEEIYNDLTKSFFTKVYSTYHPAKIIVSTFATLDKKRHIIHCFNITFELIE